MARWIICFILANMTVYGQASASQSNSRALQVTVCEVTQSPEKFTGKRISFHSLVESDGIERTVLIDDKTTCRLGITPMPINGNANSAKATDALSKAIFRGHPGTLDKRIQGEFVGVFSLVDPETVGLSPNFKRVGILRLESLSNLEITPISSAHVRTSGK